MLDLQNLTTLQEWRHCPQAGFSFKCWKEVLGRQQLPRDELLKLIHTHTNNINCWGLSLCPPSSSSYHKRLASPHMYTQACTQRYGHANPAWCVCVYSVQVRQLCHNGATPKMCPQLNASPCDLQGSHGTSACDRAQLHACGAFVMQSKLEHSDLIN
jgi:hypothetical protein